ncbi:MAG: hypothetical protein DMD96_05955 [Candidatus Rokuibacteriota bacterium]|nr:MAG: hypothetical protein DMD96_05955 [Candidatus Rokubacteria bacterium]
MRPVFLFRQTILSVLNVPAGTVTVSSASTVTVSTRSAVWRAAGRSSGKSFVLARLSLRAMAAASSDVVPQAIFTWGAVAMAALVGVMVRVGLWITR